MWNEYILEDCQSIATGLPQGKGLLLLERIKGQLSDGYWENSSQMEGYWKFVCFSEDKDGVVWIHVSNKSYDMYSGYSYLTQNRFKGKTPGWILRWFADKVGVIAREERKCTEGYAAEKGNHVASRWLRGLDGNDVWLMKKTLSGRAKDLG